MCFIIFGTEFAPDLCAGIGPLQLSVVLVFDNFKEFQNFTEYFDDHLGNDIIEKATAVIYFKKKSKFFIVQGE